MFRTISSTKLTYGNLTIKTSFNGITFNSLLNMSCLPGIYETKCNHNKTTFLIGNTNIFNNFRCGLSNFELMIKNRSGFIDKDDNKKIELGSLLKIEDSPLPYIFNTNNTVSDTNSIKIYSGLYELLSVRVLYNSEIQKIYILDLLENLPDSKESELGQWLQKFEDKNK